MDESIEVIEFKKTYGFMPNVLTRVTVHCVEYQGCETVEVNSFAENSIVKQVGIATSPVVHATGGVLASHYLRPDQTSVSASTGDANSISEGSSAQTGRVSSHSNSRASSRTSSSSGSTSSAGAGVTARQVLQTNGSGSNDGNTQIAQ